MSKFVVTGVSGNTGSVVAEKLLAAGEAVRVVVRDAAKGSAWKAKGAEVAVADLTDAKALAAALHGADGVYALVPPNYANDDLLGAQRTVIDAYAAALEIAKPKHVVLLSSIGAQHEKGTGPIQGLHYAEKRLSRLPLALTAIRASYFQENLASVLPLAKAQGILPVMFTPGKKVAMVATEDIGAVAAEALRKGPAAAGVIELAGPEDYDTAAITDITAKTLGKAVQRIDVPKEGIVPALTQAGLPGGVAALFEEMIGAINRDYVAFVGEPRRGKIPAATTIARLLG